MAGHPVWEHRCPGRFGELMAFKTPTCPICHMTYGTKSVMEQQASVRRGIVGDEMARASEQVDALISIGDEKEAAKNMQLRDQFAMAALTGMMGNIPGSLNGFDWVKNVAGKSYEIADAMMEARK